MKEVSIYKVTHDNGKAEFFTTQSQAERVCRENYYDDFEELFVSTKLTGAKLFAAILNNQNTAEWLQVVNCQTIWLEQK